MYEFKLTVFVFGCAVIQTSEDAKFYAVSRKFKPFSNKDKDLVIQFTVKHEQNIDCGGGYVKLFDCSLEQKDMHGETPYEIMFGKDISSAFIYHLFFHPEILIRLVRFFL